MSRPPGAGRTGGYGPSGSYAPNNGGRGSVPYLPPGGAPARMPPYSGTGSSVDMMPNMQNVNVAAHYGSSSAQMGSGGINPGMAMQPGMITNVSASRPTVASIWENRPPDEVRFLSDHLGAPDYFPFLRTAPEENMRPPFLDQGYSEPFIAGEVRLFDQLAAHSPVSDSFRAAAFFAARGGGSFRPKLLLTSDTISLMWVFIDPLVTLAYF